MMVAICLARLSYSSSQAFLGYITLLPPAIIGMPLSLAPIMKTPTSQRPALICCLTRAGQSTGSS